MAQEIERKFLTMGGGWRTDHPVLLRQGYLSRHEGRTVRVRIAGEAAMLTIKGRSSGISRPEFEYPIPLADATELLLMCDGPLVEKRRHHVSVGDHVWEVDEFLGDNAPLVVAEIELSAEDETFERPSWLGSEVSDQNRYFNSQLSQLPFSAWSTE